MTDDDIKRIAQKYTAYADCELTLRGPDVVSFAREVLAARQTQATVSPVGGLHFVNPVQANPVSPYFGRLRMDKPPEWRD